MTDQGGAMTVDRALALARDVAIIVAVIVYVLQNV
jgi:hypothetical protein